MSYPSSYGVPPPQGHMMTPPANASYYGSPQPQSHSPQPGYAQHPPPHQQYPGYGTPPPQGYYPPQGQYSQQPQGPYAPQGGHYAGSPAPGFPPQPTQQYQQQYPQGAYQTGYGPPPGPPGHYPPQQYGAPMGPGDPASPGYALGQKAAGDASRDVYALGKAINDRDHKMIINILAKPDPLQMELLKTTYFQRNNRKLEKDVEAFATKSPHYKQGLIALAQGPLMHDVWCLKYAVQGIGTNEKVLNDILLNRSNADMQAIKQVYEKEHKKSLESDVSSDLSLLTKELFKMVIAGNRVAESAPFNPQAISKDAADLKSATNKPGGKVDQMTVCSILASRSDGQLRAISQALDNSSHAPFERVIKEKFSGHMKHALLTIWRRALDRVMHDARSLEKCMKGMGTKDDLLVQRLVRIHWNRQHVAQVKNAYRADNRRKELSDRIRGEIGITSMNYRRLMLALIE